MCVLLPIRIGAKSARTTAPGHTEDPAPIVTSPTTYAASLMKASAAMRGVFPLKLLIIETQDSRAAARNRRYDKSQPLQRPP